MDFWWGRGGQGKGGGAGGFDSWWRVNGVVSVAEGMDWVGVGRV